SASEKRGTGPGLKGVLDRIPGGDWKYNWVHNPNAMIKSDAYAQGLFAEYKTYMTPFPQLKNEEIDAILNYASNPPEVVVAKKETGDPTEPTEGSNPLFMILIVIGVLLVLITTLRYSKIHLQNAVREKEGLPEEPAQPFMTASRTWVNNNKKLVALIGVLLMGFLTVKGWYALKGVGVYAEEVKPGKWEGYHPSQPINFSHSIHAGDNGIQCQYCHSTVEKSKTASIPSAMICMNCHKVIQSTTNEGSKEEIQKIYDAVGYDPVAATYSKVPVPLRWNKVHVLPDHVFFSHQQHVVVGGVACETCHGDVKKMTTVEQQRPLTMGWCVDCHRNTPLKMEGNGYYTELHEKMKEKYKGQPITVAMAGGIECGRCHY
ncbi:MAG TPA: cytochrome c3 family protein, partial [Bacteroidia bacterium]|nr:cytochrome c3 family protein [Bacteroidia bacterium]